MLVFPTIQTEINYTTVWIKDRYKMWDTELINSTRRNGLTELLLGCLEPFMKRCKKRFEIEPGFALTLIGSENGTQI